MTTRFNKRLKIEQVSQITAKEREEEVPKDDLQLSLCWLQRINHRLSAQATFGLLVQLSRFYISTMSKLVDVVSRNAATIKYLKCTSNRHG